MKKNLFSLLVLIVMIAALMLCVTGCQEEAAADERDAMIAQLQEENASLQKQIQALTAELETMKQKAALQSWDLKAEAWPDGNGATVTFTAVPANYTSGQNAAISVRMGDLEAESAMCLWNGEAFVGSVELSAADGYSYYCILTSADGTQEEIVLDNTEIMKNENLVYLGTSLTTYANLILDDWNSENNSLNVVSGFVQVQTPRLSADGTGVTLTKAELVFHLNGEALERRALELPAGEAAGS